MQDIMGTYSVFTPPIVSFISKMGKSIDKEGHNGALEAKAY